MIERPIARALRAALCVSLLLGCAAAPHFAQSPRFVVETATAWCGRTQALAVELDAPATGALQLAARSSRPEVPAPQ